MSKFTFQKATKIKSKLRLALVGPSGAGKTYSALAIACALAGAGRVAVIDTEHGSAAKYAGKFSFDVLELESCSPGNYVEALKAAGEAGYDVVVVDSLSHAWMGRDGALEQVDKASKRSQGNSFAAWRDVTPMHNALVEAMLACPFHLIATMRAKTEYVMEKDSRGKSVPRKIGLAPVQRDGLEYEFDVVGDVDLEHNLIVGKTRCDALDGAVVNKPGAQVAKVLLGWLSDGVDAPVVRPSFAAPTVPSNDVDLDALARYRGEIVEAEASDRAAEMIALGNRLRDAAEAKLITGATVALLSKEYREARDRHRSRLSNSAAAHSALAYLSGSNDEAKS